MKSQHIEFGELTFLDGTLSGQVQHSFSKLSIDSRSIVYPNISCFIAISGENFDGHDYIQSAYEQGVRCFIVNKEADFDALEGAAIARVEDTVSAMQSLAKFKRSKFNCPVVGITGSNGKTIVKEWLHEMLSPELRIVRSPRSFNSQIGVPLSVWRMGEKDELSLFEVGISQPGEMDALADVIQPNLGIFTHLGSAHLENFANMEALALEKAKLMLGCKKVYYNSDQPLIKESLLKAGYQGEHCCWSKKNNQANLVVLEQSDHLIRTRWNSVEIVLSLKEGGTAFRNNVLLCALFCLEQGMDPETLKKRVSKLGSEDMRMQHVEGLNGSRLISDVHNNDINALEIALDDLKRLNRPSKLLIISDILQTGIPEKELYQRVNHLISSFDIDQVVTVGPATFRNADQFILPSLHFPSTSGLLAEMDSVDFRNKAVLIKGAKQFRFDRVVRELMAKGHDSTLEINLSRLEHNLHFYRNQLSPEVKVMAMIKAYAYGSGNAEIAEILEVNHVDYLGVAYINEGIELREEGIQLPIFILNADARSFHQLVKYNLEPEIYSLHQLEKLVEELNFQRVSTPFNIHLKVDTGMHRLGFDEQNFGDVLELVKRSKSIRVASILSHLAASDDPKHDGFTLQQIATFDRLHAAATKALGYAIDRHICNTAGIMRFPKAHYEMVRIGIGVYGVPSCAEDRDQVKPVGALKTRVSQVRMIGAGESVGYTRSSMAQHERKIATIPIGYADGFPRSLSEGKGEVVIKGQRYQVVGKVCMDMTMVDITGSEIQDGDEVIVFGDNPKVTELATSAATIPYEIIAGISRRVQRLYFRD